MITREFPLSSHNRRAALMAVNEFVARLHRTGYVITHPHKKSVEGEFIIDTLQEGGFRVVIQERPGHHF